MIKECDYCDYDTCVALKELGVKGYAHPFVNVPKIPLWIAQKFLREEKNIDVLIQLETKDIHLSSKYYSIYISYMSRFRREFSYMSKNFDSYEEALAEGVKCAVKILKEK